MRTPVAIKFSMWPSVENVCPLLSYRHITGEKSEHVCVHVQLNCSDLFTFLQKVLGRNLLVMVHFC